MTGRGWEVEVGVALTRPPQEDALVRCLVWADTHWDAELIALEMAETDPDVVMAVRSQVLV